MYVAELWRYPVKSLAGERLDSVSLDVDGIAGDRVVHVENARGRVLTARVHPRLLGLHGSLGDDGEPRVDNQPWTSPDAAAAVMTAAGPTARLVRWDGPERFDILPLLVATDGAIAALGEDGRRLRPNIVVGGVEGLAERGWPGRRLRIGEAVLELEKLCKRCVMTTIDPDTLAVSPDVLRRINDEFDGRFALNCRIAEPGPVALGDPVELLA